MKKRGPALALTVCLLLLCLLPGGARAEDEVCFICVNDTLLELSAPAYTADGVTYVPYTVFNSLHVNTTYFSSSVTAMLYTTEKQIFMDIGKGYAFDALGVRYTVQAIFRNGQIYVPVGFICSYFQLSWSYTSGRGYGDLCRIKDGSVILSDSQFLDAAASLMKGRYAAYTGLSEPATPNDGPASPGEAPPEAPGETPSESHKDTAVYLSFQGVPSDAVLSALEARACRACFFLAADQVREHADTVRRIVAGGNTLGILCGAGDPLGDYEAAAALLFEAARVRTVLVAAAPGAQETVQAAAEENGLAFCGFSVDGVQGGAGLSHIGGVTERLDAAGSRADLRLLCTDRLGSQLPALLQHLKTREFSLRVTTETNHL